MLRRLALILTLVVLMLPSADSPLRPVRAQDATPVDTLSPARGRFSDQVDIGGRSLWLESIGEGSTTVIVEVVATRPFHGGQHSA
jgi:hypothetical protein